MLKFGNVFVFQNFFTFLDFVIIPPATKLWGGGVYWNRAVRPSVLLSVRPSVDAMVSGL
jgi:hypothetical protein